MCNSPHAKTGIERRARSPKPKKMKRIFGHRNGCLMCGSSAVRPGRYYCSMKCRSQHRSLESTIVKVCEYCGDLFLSRKAKSLSKRVYCSLSCAALGVERSPRTHYRGMPIGIAPKIWKSENRDRLLVYNREYGIKNKETISKRQSDWYNKNRDRLLQKSKEYYSENPKRKESIELYRFFGTSKSDQISLDTKKKFAQYTVCKKAVSGKINKSVLKHKLQKINEGETYAAYL